MVKRKSKSRKSSWLSTLSKGDFQSSTLTMMAYLEAGLVPPANMSPWHPPHVPSMTHGETAEPCTFPRDARRKFRKEWRRALAALQKGNDITARAAGKYKSMVPNRGGSALVPTLSARSARRALVLDSMVRLGEQMLEREQASPSAVESEHGAGAPAPEQAVLD